MLLAKTEEEKLPLLPVSSMFYVRSFFWSTFSNVRAPNIWYLKTALSLNLFKSYSSTLPWASWHVVYWGNRKVAVYVIFILRNKMNENVKKMQKRQVIEDTRMCWHVFLTCCREVFCIVVWGSLLSFPAPWKWSDTPPAGFFTDEPKLKLRSNDSANSRTLKHKPSYE